MIYVFKQKKTDLQIDIAGFKRYPVRCVKSQENYKPTTE
jgi:hypothetical protein